LEIFLSLLDTILELLGLLGTLGVLALAIRGKLFRITPIFCCYLAWCLLSDILFFLLNRYFSYFGQNYFRIYMAEMVLDSAFQFAVLVELGWTVLRPIRSSLPRHSALILTLIFGVAGALVWPVSAYMLPARLNASAVLFVHAQQTIAILRVIIFLGLAAFSQLLSIGWRNRELQIATGLGFYSMCSLAMSVVHSHQTVINARYYHIADQIAAGSYVCSLIYWLVSFSQQEQERQEFTPQMRSFLLTVTGAARGTRMALADSAIGPRKDR
jgi:hypothetical protein